MCSYKRRHYSCNTKPTPQLAEKVVQHNSSQSNHVYFKNHVFEQPAIVRSEKHNDYTYFLEGTTRGRTGNNNSMLASSSYCSFLSCKLNENTASSAMKSVNKEHRGTIPTHGVHHFNTPLMKNKQQHLLDLSSQQQHYCPQLVFEKVVFPFSKQATIYPVEENYVSTTSSPLSSSSSLSDYDSDELTAQEALYYRISLSDPEYKLKLLAHVACEILKCPK